MIATGHGAVTLWLEGVGLLAPGIDNWPSGARLLRGEADYHAVPSALPAPALLPPAECRRASRPVKLCLALGIEACAAAQRPAAALASVFCSSNPDGHTVHAVLEALSGDERSISPTRFHNSVHNATAGYWSIAVRCLQPYQVLCAFDATFAAALLEAALQAIADQLPVLMVAYDSEYPEPLHACRPIPDVGGIALVLSPRQTAQARARLQVGIHAQSPGPERLPPGHLAMPRPAGAAPASAMTLAHLPGFIPALAGLPLLDAIANRRSEQVELPYLPGRSLFVQVQPC
jgi:hypothetical protein